LKILVTGGAGYIGSHAVKILGEKGYEILTLDNLSSGHKEAVLYGKFIKLDLREKIPLEEVVESFSPEAVMHFAGSALVEESYKYPLKYYENNLISTINLLNAMIKAKVKYIIFSSSASVYGNTSNIPIKEEERLAPINPYGKTKFMIEEILSDFDRAYGIKYISLRYFNAAGADESKLIGERHSPETHLIPSVLEVALGKREKITIYGTDYPTPDGTCIRDYIYVNDLIEAHILSLEYLLNTNNSRVYNLGNERGYSVREVINATEEITKRRIKLEEGKRRQGDPAILIASSKKIKQELSWQPKRQDLSYIIKTAWDFMNSNNFR
jgi:UDP-glucose 4-epimerase